MDLLGDTIRFFGIIDKPNLYSDSLIKIKLRVIDSLNAETVIFFQIQIISSANIFYSNGLFSIESNQNEAITFSLAITSAKILLPQSSKIAFNYLGGNKNNIKLIGTKEQINEALTTLRYELASSSM